MQRQPNITLGEMRSAGGPTRLLVYCADYKCAHSVVIDTNRWATMCACRTLSRTSPVRLAAIGDQAAVCSR